MNAISSIATSGMATAMLGMNVAANNIANQQTPGYHRQVVVPQTQAAGGVTASVAQAPQAGSDLVADVVQQRMALYAFQANALVVQSGNRMLGALIDLQA